MTTVTTIALLTKKDGMSAGLFSRYWRDVHGVLAARIPGFSGYTQFHLGARVRGISLPAHMAKAPPAAARFHGIAEVTFADEAARAGLASSEVAALIQADEQNVFKTSLLYNLAPGASRTYVSKRAAHAYAGCALLVGLRAGYSAAALLEAIGFWLVPALTANSAVIGVHVHALTSGDPDQWATAGVNNQQTPATAIEAILLVDGATSLETLHAINIALSSMPAVALDAARSLDVYRIAGRHAMVVDGRPTHLGLRGLKALQTITLAGAHNQLSNAVTEHLYGIQTTP